MYEELTIRRVVFFEFTVRGILLLEEITFWRVRFR